MPRLSALLVAPLAAGFLEKQAGCRVGDCQAGFGRYEMPDGGAFEGFFEGGKSHGIGELAYASGAVYRGEFVGGAREGLGSYV